MSSTYFDPPQSLRERPIWVTWKEEERNGKPTKIPYTPDTGHRAASDDPETWAAFPEAVNAIDRADGIGFVFPDNEPVTGIDLDDVRDPETGAIDERAQKIVDDVNSYTEVSPSGTGLHIVAWGTKPGDRCRTSVDGGEIEMYDEGRYFTFTGDHLDGTPTEVKERQDAIEDVYQAYLADDEAGGSTPTSAGDLDLSDEELIEKAKAARNSDTFETLWAGDTTGYESPSEADFALCCSLAFWTQKDPDQMDRLFRQSGLMRTKWDEDRGDETYGERTIRKAINETDDVYRPGQGFDSLAGELQAQVVAPFFAENGISINTARHRAAGAFDTHLDFLHPGEETKGWRNTLHVYVDGSLINRPADEGTYQPYGEVEIERLGEEHLGGLFNTEFKNQVVRKLERRNHVRRRAVSTPPERLVVSNGILDLTTGELSEHTPEEYHQTRLGIAYEPDAECPRIDEFLHQVVDRSDVATLYRFIAHALYQDYPEEKAVMLLGEGANGKSTFLHLVEQFLGDRNVSNQSLQDITERRFAPNLLRGKQANIHADMSDQNVDSLRMFKNLTGRDTVQADVKYESPVTFTNHATMFFACNDLPVLKDDTQGHWRRWGLIWFTRSFSKSDDDYVPRRQLDRDLTADSELEGLLARCVEEIKAWDAGRAWFPDVDDWKTTRRKMRKAAEPVFGFAETCLRRADGNLRKEDVRDAYAQYATEEGIAKMGREQFGRKLLNLPDLNIDAGQNRVNGDPQPTYQGIEFTSRGQQLLDKACGNLPEHGSLNGISSRKAVVDAFQDKPVTRDELAARTGLDDIDDVIERLHEDGTIIRLPTDGGEERYVLG